jgi:putative phosphoesterase
VAWTLEHADDRSKRFMRDLPFDLRFELAGKGVRLVHGSPRKVNEYLLEDRAASTFERIAQLADCDILLFGHTHKPWVREYGGVLFVNCGSVGKPKDGDPRGSFALLDQRDGDVNVSIERVAYDAEAVATEIHNVGLPHELADQLVRAE